MILRIPVTKTIYGYVDIDVPDDDPAFADNKPMLSKKRTAKKRAQDAIDADESCIRWGSENDAPAASLGFFVMNKEEIIGLMGVNLITTLATRAAYMEAKNLIWVGGTVDKELLFAEFCYQTAMKWDEVSLQDDALNYDEYIEDALLREYGANAQRTVRHSLGERETEVLLFVELGLKAARMDLAGTIDIGGTARDEDELAYFCFKLIKEWHAAETKNSVSYEDFITDKLLQQYGTQKEDSGSQIPGCKHRD